ncbi:heterokaryon incompatibility protein-domain-containing protein [Xylaria curta]|nr:heterokaryon incompatibility protein-domain-containing protein [Xylaria curta]
MPALQLGHGMIRRIYSTIQDALGVIILASKRCISLFFILIIVLFRLTIYLFYLIGVLRVVLRVVKVYTSLQEAIPRFVLRVFTYNARPYLYRILDQSNSGIRLLKISSIDAVYGIQSLKLVNAHLISCPLASAPPFAAVSYRWTSDHYVPIMVDRRRMMVSHSIHQLLITLQTEANDAQEDRYLWIDSICINQADTKEKSWQVELMKGIYRSATHVIGWLGPDAPPVSTWRGIDGVRDAANIICNDFFFRTWIIQEMSLAKKVVMRTKHDSCQWDEGVVGVSKSQGPSFSLYGENEFGLPSEIMPRVSQGIKNMSVMDSFRMSLKDHPDGLPISELLIRSLDFKCSDSRDRIYGLLGLTTEKARSSISVKYHDSYSALDASIQVVRFSLTDESSFELLELSGVGADQAGLPGKGASERVSWVPDWQNSHIARRRETLHHARSHKTATFRPCHINSPVMGSDDTKSLHIEGAIIDTVKEILTTTWNLPKTCDFRDKGSLAQIYDFLEKLDMVCEIARGDKVLTPSVTGNVHDAIIRTVMNSGSLIKTEPPAFEKLRVDMEQLSRTLRTRLAGEKDRVRRDRIIEMDFRHFIMGFEEFMPLIVGRKLCVTEQGRFAIVPPSTQADDRICAFSGAPNPFVLRSCDVSRTTPGAYQIIGASYLDQVMRGELAEVNLNWEIFHVV